MKPNKSFRNIQSVSALATIVLSLALPSAQAATRIKQDNTDPLNQASSWDTLPNAADIAQSDSTVTTANSTVLGADFELVWHQNHRPRHGSRGPNRLRLAPGIP